MNFICNTLPHDDCGGGDDDSWTHEHHGYVNFVEHPYDLVHAGHVNPDAYVCGVHVSDGDDDPCGCAHVTGGDLSGAHGGDDGASHQRNPNRMVADVGVPTHTGKMLR